MKWTFRRKIRLAIGLALVVLAVMTALSFFSVRSFQADSLLVAHSNKVIARLEEIRSLISEAESGQHGYLITQQDDYIQPFNDSHQAISLKLTELEGLISDNPVQEQNLNGLLPLVRQRLDLLQQGIKINQEQGFQAAKALILENNGLHFMQQIQASLDRMVGVENNLLQQRLDKAQTGSSYTSLTFITLALLSAGLLALVSYLLRQYTNDRRKSEAALTAQKDFANSVLNLSPIGKAVMDTRHKVIVWNPAMAAITGLSPAEMVGTRRHSQAFYQDAHPTLNDMIIDQDFSRLDELYEDYRFEQKPQGQRIQAEKWFTNLNGQRRFIAFEANPIYNQEGGLIAAMTAFQDLTERKKAEDALRESETRFRLLIERLHVGVTMTGPEAQVQMANQTATEMLGLTPDQLIGKTSFDSDWKCIHEDGTDFPGEAHPVPQAIRTGKPVRNVTLGVYRPKDESWIWLLVNAEPLLDEAGQVAHVICSFSDITERKKVEQLKTEFISVVSHELRTPLTSILGSLGLIMGGVAGEVTPAARAMLEIAHKNSERLVRLINDILDIEKIESGKMIFHLKPLELVPLVEQAIEATRSFAGQYGVKFQADVKAPPAGFRVKADTDRLTQVIINLLSNAAKFSPPGETVRVAVFAVDDKTVRVSVSDKGPGISEEFQGRIFEKFAQADSSDTRQKGGTGLGLSISKAIIQKLKGEIGFTTRAGEGATFYFDLPRLVDAPQGGLLLQPEPERGDLTALEELLRNPAAESGLKILVCEDDPDVALLLYQTFRHLGFGCDIAYNAAETRRLLALNTYAVMSLDLLLPDEDGMTLLRDLRNQASTRLMPIIVVSAIADQGEIEFNGQAFTVVDWIDKPIDQARLISAVKTATRAGLTASNRPRILHIEDDRDLVQVVAALLAEVAQVSSARTVKEALARLEQEKFDLILLDVELPDNTSASLPALLNNPALGAIPVVVFSGQELDPEISRKIAAGLIKSRTTNRELLNTIQTIFDRLEISSGQADLKPIS